MSVPKRSSPHPWRVFLCHVFYAIRATSSHALDIVVGLTPIDSHKVSVAGV